MIDALRAVQSVLVIGAGSDIARATVRQLAAGGRLERVVLAGRPGRGRDAAQVEVGRLLGARSMANGTNGTAGSVEVVDLDITDLAHHEPSLGPVFGAGDIDVVVLAAGVLPEAPTLTDPLAAAHVMSTNAGGCVSALTVVAAAMRRQGHGSIVVLSSVAAERPRRSNYLYGASKAGLDAFSRGLAEDLRPDGVTVLTIRPGFVRSSMTAGLTPAPLAVDPADVATAIVAALPGPSRVVWVPRAMRGVMSVLRHLPAPVFRRLPL